MSAMNREHPLAAREPAMRLALASAPSLHRPGVAPFPLSLRDAVMLAWLALEGPTPRTRLAMLLWPDSDLENARNALRQRLFKLKKQLGAELVVGVVTLSLAEGVEHDLGESDSVLGEEGDTQFGGELDTWIAQQRERRRGRLRGSLVELSDLAEQARDYADALSHANELRVLDPLSEEAHRRVIRLHYLAGDRAAALVAFDRCEQVLKDEVGARPSAQTMDLLRIVESAGSTAQPAPMPLAVPASVLRPPRLVGRTAELGAALQAWSVERAFCLEGEAGMGKSRLLQEVAAHRPDAVCIQARPGDAVVPYATLVRLLRALLARSPLRDATLQRSLVPVLPELGGPLRLIAADDRGQRLALDEALLGVLATARGAGVGALVVDDLHFADDASLEMLLQLVRPGSGPSFLWGFARRPVEGSEALRSLYDALMDEQRLDPITLAPLTREQLAELVQSLGLPPLRVQSLADMLHRHSGGNPLFALETLRQAWVDTGLEDGKLPRPVSVTRLIERRLARLSPSAIRLARCAAVAGSDFSIELAAGVLSVSVIDLADAWRELEQAQVFIDGAFAHDLIYETVRRGVPQPIARHLHAELAAYLEQHHGAPASIAAHWLQAQQVPRALPFLRQAGELARDQRRFAEAASAFEREAELRLAQGDAEGAFAAALSMRSICFELDLAGRTDAALALLDRAARTPLQRAMVSAERADVSMHRGAIAEAEQAAQSGLDALELAGEGANSEVRADLHRHLAAVRLWQQRVADAYALLQAVQVQAEASNDANRRFEFAQGYGVVLDHLDRPGESARWYRMAADTALGMGKLPEASQVLLNLAIGWRDSGRLDLAHSTLLEAQAVLASLPEGAIPYSSLDLNQGIVLRDMGRYAECLQWFERAIERAKAHIPGWVPLLLGHRAQAWLTLGQFARAQQDIEAADVEGSPPMAQARRHVVLGQLMRALGKDAAPSFERAFASLGPGGRPLSRHRMLLARCIVVEPAQALADAGEVLDAALASQRLGIQRAARVRLCQAALALGHGAEAARHARQLVRMTPADGTDDVYRAEAWLVAHLALAEHDATLASTVLRDAVAWVESTRASGVPPDFRESFLHRNPVNRELLALAARASR